MSKFNPDINNSDCSMCGGTQSVEVIPHGGSENDSESDECPHCLRRSVSNLKITVRKGRRGIQFNRNEAISLIEELAEAITALPPSGELTIEV